MVKFIHENLLENAIFVFQLRPKALSKAWARTQLFLLFWFVLVFSQVFFISGETEYIQTPM